MDTQQNHLLTASHGQQHIEDCFNQDSSGYTTKSSFDSITQTAAHPKSASIKTEVVFAVHVIRTGIVDACNHRLAPAVAIMNLDRTHSFSMAIENNPYGV